MIKVTLKYMSITALCLLTGCMGVYEEGFDCKPGEGVGCKSISEVNTMINQGKLLKNENREINDKKGIVTSYKSCSVNSLKHPNQRVWFSPHWEEHQSLNPIHLLREESRE